MSIGSRLLLLCLILAGCTQKKKKNDSVLEEAIDDLEHVEFSVEHSTLKEPEKPSEKVVTKPKATLRRTATKKGEPTVHGSMKWPIKGQDVQYNGNTAMIKSSQEVIAPCDSYIESLEGSKIRITPKDPKLSHIKIELDGVTDFDSTINEAKSGDKLGTSGGEVTLSLKSSKPVDVKTLFVK